MKNLPRYLEVIYCDDIREEVGSKASYMGVYSGELMVPSAPVVLPKLCAVAKLSTKVNDPFETVDVRIYAVKGEEETQLLSTGPVAIPSNLSETTNDNQRTVVQLNFMLSPFQITEDILLRVKAFTGREELWGSSALRIRVAHAATNVSHPATIQ